ncbi:MAG: aminotransferase class V-fold PLP-dependent enzyme [Calditrichia bacterium]
MLSKKDIVRFRSESPGCSEVLHFNNAGAALMPQAVLDAQIDYLNLEARIGGYEAKSVNANRYADIYTSIAKLLNADIAEVALMENATVAWLAAFGAISFKPGDRIVIARESYASNYLNFLLVKERFGVEIVTVDPTDSGELSLDDLQNKIDDRTRLIAITHIPTGGGVVNPAEAVGKLERPSDCYYLLDGCQSAGQMPVDMQKIGCDFFSATGRKWLRGPRGTGFLYVRKDRLEELKPAVLDLHSAELLSSASYVIRDDARRFENWESNFAAHFGLGVAVDYALEVGIEAIWQRVQQLAKTLRSGLAKLPGVTVHDIGTVQSGIVTFSSERENPATIQQRLRKDNINVSIAVPSGTILDAEARKLPDMIRASAHYYNTEEEIERFLTVL